MDTMVECVTTSVPISVLHVKDIQIPLAIQDMPTVPSVKTVIMPLMNYTNVSLLVHLTVNRVHLKLVVLLAKMVTLAMHVKTTVQ